MMNRRRFLSLSALPFVPAAAPLVPALSEAAKAQAMVDAGKLTYGITWEEAWREWSAAPNTGPAYETAVVTIGLEDGLALKNLNSLDGRALIRAIQRNRKIGP